MPCKYSLYHFILTYLSTLIKKHLKKCHGALSESICATIGILLLFGTQLFPKPIQLRYIHTFHSYLLHYFSRVIYKSSQVVDSFGKRIDGPPMFVQLIYMYHCLVQYLYQHLNRQGNNITLTCHIWCRYGYCRMTDQAIGT